MALKTQINSSTRFASERTLRCRAQLALQLALVTFAIVGFSQARAGNPTFAAAATVTDASCAKSSGDSSERAVRFTQASNRLSGQCLDTSIFRPVDQLSFQNGKLHFRNYFYRNQFWEADLNLDANTIESVYFQIKKFTVFQGIIAAHTQVRYKLASGAQINLVNQLTGEKAQASDLLISFEAGRSVGVDYNAAQGAFPNYALVGRVGEGASFFALSPLTLEQYELNLSAQEGAALLIQSLSRSQQIANTSFYSTLRPNCTTEQFDLLDSLPRLAGRNPRFLTMLSNDPVALPSLRALNSRGLIKRRVQDFSDEIKGITQVLQIPNVEVQMPPFMPTMKGYPWALVVTQPKLDLLPQDQRRALESLKSLLVKKAIELVNAHTGSLVLAFSGQTDASVVLARALADVQNDLRAAFAQLDRSLPSEVKTMGIYFVPVRSDQMGSSLAPYGYDINLPVNVFEFQVDPQQRIGSDAFYWIAEGARLVSDAGQSVSLPAYLMSTAIVANVVRGNSTINSQVLLGLNASNHEFIQTNEQVAFETATINAGRDRGSRATLLLSHQQTMAGGINKSVSVEFGPYGGLAGTKDMTRFAVHQVHAPLSSSSEDCQIRAQAVPNLNGHFAKSATGNSLVDRILAGRAVSFQVLNAQVDLERLNVSDMKLNIETWPISCLADRKVDRQFADQVNVAADQFKKKVNDQAGSIFALINSLLAGGTTPSGH